MYYGGGYEWEEEPMCSMCFERPAMYVTAHSGIVLCGDPDCHAAYVMQECAMIKYDDEEQEEPVWWKKMINREWGAPIDESKITFPPYRED